MDSLQYIDHFKTTPAWAQMVATVEDSPWHREANVSVHTEMVLAQFERYFAPNRSDRHCKIARIALLYHDVGKPAAEEVVEGHPTRGTYRRYAGHEQDSAVAFTEAWLSDPHLRALLDPVEARVVRWLIEHHLPYGLKDVTKRARFKIATLVTLDDFGLDLFYDVLRSDAAGRISDGHAEKLADVEAWIAEFDAFDPKCDLYSGIEAKDNVCYLMVGPSGSGKSTFVGKRMRKCDRVVSDDDVKMQRLREEGLVTGDAKKDYEAAFTLMTQKEKEHKAALTKHANAAFAYAKGANSDVYVDVTGLSPKVRAQWVERAKAAKMYIVAVEFWNPLDVLLARQSARPEKEVPVKAVKQQYFAQTCAMLGSECHEVILVANGQEVGRDWSEL